MSRYESVRGACDALARPMSAPGHLMTRQCRTCNLPKASGKDAQGRSWSYDGRFWDCPACTAEKLMAQPQPPRVARKPVAEAAQQSLEQPAKRPKQIRTLEDFKAWCVVDEESGCWLWQRSKKNRFKVHSIDPHSDEIVEMGLRRTALNLSRKNPVPQRHCTWAKVCCPHENCGNPRHAMSGTPAAWGKYKRHTGLTADSRHLGDHLAPYRAALQIISVEQARVLVLRMRAGEKPKALAQELGVSVSLIRKIRAGKRVCDAGVRYEDRKVAANASIFLLGQSYGGGQ